MQNLMDDSSLIFYDRLFQRGQTWEECRAGWERGRKQFARLAAQNPVFPKTQALLEDKGYPLRLAITFADGRTDCLCVLPLLGSLFDRFNHIEARYFDHKLFFPLLMNTFGRKAPMVGILGAEGKVRQLWGPRPEPLSARLEALSAPSAKAQALTAVEDKEMIDLLDQALAPFFAESRS